MLSQLLMGMTNKDWVGVVAVVLGPLAAVLITLALEQTRERSARRMDVFRTLMRTRRTPTFLDHVGALNLVEIEFAKNPKVLAAWKELFTHFATQHPRRADEQADPGKSLDENASAEGRFNGRLAQERARLLAKMLHAIARELGFKVEQLDIFEGGYTPQGWHDELTQTAEIRKYLIDLAVGRRWLPVGIFHPKPQDEKPPQDG